MSDDDIYAEDLNAGYAEDENPRIVHSGHLGMAVKLAETASGKLLFVHRKGWHRWDGTRWAPDGDGTARRHVHRLLARERAACNALPREDAARRAAALGRLEIAPAINGVLTEASVLQEFSTVIDDVDADPWQFNCANGTLDLHSTELSDHNPADRITKVARAAYRPDAAGVE